MQCRYKIDVELIPELFWYFVRPWFWVFEMFYEIEMEYSLKWNWNHIDQILDPNRQIYQSDRNRDANDSFYGSMDNSLMI